VASALQPPDCTVTKEIDRRKTGPKRRGRPMADCMACSSGLEPRLCDEAGIIYTFRCVFCREPYIGETGRSFRQRIEEHHVKARLRTPKTPWGIHMSRFHPDKDIGPRDRIFFGARILARESRAARRKIREAIEVRERKPSINITSGWSLSGYIILSNIWHIA